MVNKQSVCIRESGGDRLMLTIFYLVLALFAASTLYPFINILASAFSGYTANVQGNVFLLPKDFQVHTMLRVVGSSRFLNSAWVSLQVTVMGTLLSLLVSTLAAYALSRPYLRGRSMFTVLFVFTMMFSAGIVPGYMLMRNLKLLNTIYVLFLPGAVNVYNMLVLKSNFESLPLSLEESAKLDGASNFMVMCRIMIPISLPTYAAVSLFLSVGYWNSYMNAVFYITKEQFKPLQMYLMDVINHAMDPLAGGVDAALGQTDAPNGVRACAILASMIPVLMVYPFLQKYFVKGIMIGSVKE